MKGLGPKPSPCGARRGREGPGLATMKPLSIVIADDLQEIQHIVSVWLAGDGHTVTCASGGREVIRLLGQREFDLVITDMLMPDGDGVEVLTALRKMQRRTRVLAISGGGTYLRAHDVLNVARGFGASGILMKPFNRQQLLDAVAAIVGEVESVPARGGEAAAVAG